MKPPNSVWMEDAKLKNVMLCQPEYRNVFNKLFGGFIMRQAFELAWACAHVYTPGLVTYSILLPVGLSQSRIGVKSVFLPTNNHGLRQLV